MTYIKIILLAACFELMNCLGISVKDEASSKTQLEKQDLSEIPAPIKENSKKTASGYFPIHILIR